MLSLSCMMTGASHSSLETWAIYCNILLFRVESIFAHFAQGPWTRHHIPSKILFTTPVFHELWEWVLKGVTDTVQSTVVMYSVRVMVRLTWESLSPRTYIWMTEWQQLNDNIMKYIFLMTKNITWYQYFLFSFYSKPACTKALIIPRTLYKVLDNTYVFCLIYSMTVINQQTCRGLMIEVLMSTLIFSIYVKLWSPANTRRWSSAGVILGQHQRQWASIPPTLDQRVVFTRDRLNVVRELWTCFLACVSELSDSFRYSQIYANITQICAQI